MIHGPALRRLALPILAGLVLLAASTSASAGPVWQLDSVANTIVAPGGTQSYYLMIANVGDATADTTAPGQESRLTGTIPAGMTVVNAFSFSWDCSASTAQALDCINNSDPVGTPANSNGDDNRVVRVDVAVDGNAGGTLISRFALNGGGAAPVTTADATEITAAPPMFGIDAFDGQVTADAAGTPYTQAAGHPYAASTSIDFNTIRHPTNPSTGDLWPVAPPRDIFVDLPPGFIGSPAGVAQCTPEQLSNSSGTVAQPRCPPSSQIGTALVRVSVRSFPTQLTPFPEIGPIPVFNVIPPSDAPARFGFNVAGSVVTMDAVVRSSSDYGVTVKVRNIPEGLDVAGTTLTLWGVPADPVHDFERACPGSQAPSGGGPTCGSGAALKPFLRNPTSCPLPDVGLPTTMRMDSWADPGEFVERTFYSHLPGGYPFPVAEWGPQQGTTGCAAVPFDPALAAQPATTATGKPSGFSFDVTLPQGEDQRSIGQADVKKVTVTLPQGVRVSPSSAQGLDACSPTQIGLHSETDPACPEASKIGTVTVDTPLLDTPLQGSVYLASPHDNPFGTLIAVYLVARGEGVTVKLAGRVDNDPKTGQITSTFDDNPQTPFSRLHLEFKGGPRAPLVTPKQCGTYTTQSKITSWSGRIVDTTSDFSVSHDGRGAPCPPAQFNPGFVAGTEDPIAGKTSSLHLSFTRSDDDQELRTVTVNLPNGLTGKIANVPLCGESAAQAGTCGDASKIGSVVVGAGAGTAPFYVKTGRAYLTGPYKGAPYGISIVVPAIAGPFNLGNVVVRSAIFVDKHTAELRVISDPLPSVLQGIPLDVRDVRVAVDRRDFTVNPTNCARKTISGVLTSTEGKSANVSSRFQVGECASLAFKPKLGVSVGSSGHTARNATVPLTTTLRMPAGNANLRSVRVTLPKTINARLTVINRACTRAMYEIGRCEAARAGTATAATPLLSKPLRGNVYFVKNGNPIPDLFIALRGQVSFDLIGKVSIPNSTYLATTFDSIPDVPVKRFTLKLFPGKKGTVGAAANLCTRGARDQKAKLDFVGQNGRAVHVDQKLDIQGCGGSGQHKRGRGTAHRRGH